MPNCGVLAFSALRPVFFVSATNKSLVVHTYDELLQINIGKFLNFVLVTECPNDKTITVSTRMVPIFVIIRGPVNEDIFTAPPRLENQSLQPGIQELTEQIHQLLMQVSHLTLN